MLSGSTPKMRNREFRKFFGYFNLEIGTSSCTVHYSIDDDSSLLVYLFNREVSKITSDNPIFPKSDRFIQLLHEYHAGRT